MSGQICPYCQKYMSISDGNCHETYICYGYDSNTNPYLDPDFHSDYSPAYKDELINVYFLKCPNPECGEISIYLKGLGPGVKDIKIPVKPNSYAKKFPNYIPEQIIEDYEEAYAILHLSPKASATLSRRCLQGIIRDYWKVKPDTLFNEITQLRDHIQDDLWKVIDAVRKLGNIAAHMEKDVNLIVDIEPEEAEKLLKLIELLFKDWYIASEERKNLFDNIIDINKDKQASRISKSS